MFSTYKYHILWIDDQYEEMSSFIDVCKRNDIELTPCQFAIDGMSLFEEKLSYWDGVILDAKQQKEQNSARTLEGLAYCKKVIHQLQHRRQVPFYILTGQPDLFDNDVFCQTYGHFYEKDNEESEKQLLQDIKHNADNLEYTRLRQLYPDAFNLPEIGVYGTQLKDGPDSDLMIAPDGILQNVDTDMLKILQYLDKDKSDKEEVFNQIRMVLDWVMSYLKHVGILQIELSGSNINKCSTWLGNKRLGGTDGVIPTYIQRSLHSCVVVANNGSHRLDVFSDTRNGVAPYLIRSTIYELLNILCWCKNLPTNDGERSKLRSKVEKLLSDTPQEDGPMQKSSSEEVPDYEGLTVTIDQDQDNNFFHEDCVLPYKKCEGHLGERVKILSVSPNTNPNSNKYKWFASVELIN